jgi:hypothetical protein
MLSKGPIPRFAHGMLEYLVGGLLIAAPWLFDFGGGNVTAVCIVAGVAVIALAALTEGTSGLVDTVPVSTHAAIDYVLAGAFIAAPFVFGFADDGGPTALFIVLGVAHILVTIGTAYRRPAAAEQDSGERRRFA